MRVTIPYDPTRSFVLAAYWAGAAAPYWQWASGRWVATFDAACLLTPTPGVPPFTDLYANIPDGVAIPAVQLVCFAVAADGTLMEVDSEVMVPGWP